MSLGPSKLERDAQITGILLIVVAPIWAAVTEDVSAVARCLGVAGLLALAIRAVSRGIRLHGAGVTASLPRSLGKTNPRLRPPRALSVSTFVLALVLPLAAVVAFLALVSWAWLPVTAVALLGCMAATREETGDGEFWLASHDVSERVTRLCVSADMPVPDVLVQPDSVATAWTSGGRIHLTVPLVELLDERELEAVLAHELAHLARRDAAVMEICSAPSRVLLGFSELLDPRLSRLTWDLPYHGGSTGLSLGVVVWLFALLSIPPAYVIGWISRLSVLAMSRAREFSADAAAVTLTGRPSALRSALMKLERQGDWTPLRDLRDIDPVLCIVGTPRPRFGRLFSAHPATVARVERLEALETRLQNAR